MKQATTLTPAQREALYLELAPTDIEYLPVIMPEQKPIPAPEQKQERQPSGTLTREQLTAKIRQDYYAELERQQANDRQVSKAAGTLAVVKLSAVGAGGFLAYNILANFNPVAFGVTAVVAGLVGLATYPRKAKAGQPTWMPREGGNAKTQIANVNPVVNVTVNMNQ